jgi:hypothetical protein
MARVPIRSCGCIDWPCCGHTDVMLTGQDALDAHEDDLDRFDQEMGEPPESPSADCDHCLMSPCVCDQLHDQAVEDRLGGGGLDY